MPNQPHSDDLLEVIQREEFLAFFTFDQPAGTGAELTGLVKVARPCADGKQSPLNYVSLTFIADAPNESAFRAAQTLFARDALAGFQRHVPGVRALTSLPATRFRGPHYIHQLDLVFSGGLPQDVRTLLSEVAVAVRQTFSVQTEAPQFWSDPDQAPEQTEAEKANFGARLKALMALFAC